MQTFIPSNSGERQATRTTLADHKVRIHNCVKLPLECIPPQMNPDSRAPAPACQTLDDEELIAMVPIGSYSPAYDDRPIHKGIKYGCPSPPRRYYLILLALCLVFLGVNYIPYFFSESKELAEAAVAAMSSSEDPLHGRANFEDMTLVGTLNASLVPHPDDGSSSSNGLKGRLIVIGDIHGMKQELERMLAKLEFDKTRDHLVCAGDVISKGPDSVGVVELLMDIGASGVRGNHEDRILLVWKGMHSKSISLGSDSMLLPSSPDQEPLDTDAALGEMLEFSRSKEYKDRELAKKFTKKQIEWLQDLPVILKVGEIEGLGSVVVAHGGLEPGLPLKRQDPYAVMNMRTVDMKTGIPSEKHKGTAWSEVCSSNL